MSRRNSLTIVHNLPPEAALLSSDCNPNRDKARSEEQQRGWFRRRGKDEVLATGDLAQIINPRWLKIEFSEDAVVFQETTASTRGARFKCAYNVAGIIDPAWPGHKGARNIVSA